MIKLCKYFWSKVVCPNGSTLAEFAVVTVMMATLVGTSAPKLSELLEYGKRTKTLDQIDKILVVASKFYNETTDSEGRGRFPGQDKYDMAVGGYDNIDSLEIYLPNFTVGNDDQSYNWASVFGVDNPKALAPDGSQYFNDAVEDSEYCSNCPKNRSSGHEEWLILTSMETFVSPFQDGHYIYIVLPGIKNGSQIISPKLIVADAENPSQLHKILAL
tara:strand:- start:276 stop:923 length:648 start_codon:yes stop_codon:yes gene_type:complete